jgi:hypothetical protein
MKPILPCLMTALAINGFAALPVRADNPTTVTTTRTVTTVQTDNVHGVITSKTPDSIIMTSKSGAAPVTYNFTRTTEYFDEAGHPVSVEVVKSGVPVTVQYTREGNRLIAQRVTVYAPSSATPGTTPSVALHKTTTTTEAPDGTIRTRTHEHGDITTHGIYAKGVMSSRTPDSFVIQSETETVPVTYYYTSTTQYVNDAGQPVSVEVARSGAPVTVEYVRDGDRLRATRVIVHEKR